MNNEIILICVLSALAVMCVFVAMIIVVKSRVSLNKEDKDFFDKFVAAKKTELSTKPNAIKFTTYLTLAISMPVILGASSYFLVKNIVLSLGLFTFGFFIPEIIVRMSAKKQERLFEERYARALRQLASSLRAGLTIQQAVDDLCKCKFIHYTVRDAFSEVSAAIRIGISIPDAFKRMAEKINNDDVKDVASAVAMQFTVGGSESEVIETISENISSRIMTRKEINSIFSGTKVTIIGMSILPFVIVFALFNGSPTYFSPCKDSPLALVIIISMFALMIVGIGVMFKMYRKGVGK